MVSDSTSNIFGKVLVTPFPPVHLSTHSPSFLAPSYYTSYYTWVDNQSVGVHFHDVHDNVLFIGVTVVISKLHKTGHLAIIGTGDRVHLVFLGSLQK